MSHPAVRKWCWTVVRPDAITPASTLELSPLDKIQNHREMTDELFVYSHGRQPGKAVRGALARALTHYYPIAGRLGVSDKHGGLVINCTGDGVLLVEASAGCTLNDVNHLEPPVLIDEADIVPRPRRGIDPEDALMLMQVTDFKCGGFSVTLSFNHVVCDGLGIGQFLKAASELARGLPLPSVEPIWCRDAIPNPPTQTPPPANAITPIPLHLVYLTTDIPRRGIDRLRNRFRRETGKACSVFDVVTAILWQSRTRAIGADTQNEVLLGFPVSVRGQLGKVLPRKGEGYYGNCIDHAALAAPAEKIATATTTYIISLIRDAKDRAGDEFWKRIRGEARDDPFQRMADSLYDTLIAVDQRSLGLNEVDFGFGAAPIRYHPLTRNDFMPSCVLVESPVGSSFAACRLITRAVKVEHLQALRHQLRALMSVSAI